MAIVGHWHNLVLLAETATLVSKIEKTEKSISQIKRKMETLIKEYSFPSSPSPSHFSLADDENPTESLSFGRKRTNHDDDVDDDVARKKPKNVPLWSLTVTKRKRNTIRKKRLIAPLFSASSPSPKEAAARRSSGSPRVPEAKVKALRERITAELGGRDFILVMQKKLFPTDVKRNNNRLSLPAGELRVCPEAFLRKEEIARMVENKQKLNVSVVDQNYRDYRLNLTAWPMSGNVVYNLISKWNSVVKNNALCQNDVVQLWAFRCRDGELGFAVAVAVAKVNNDGSE